MGLYQIFRTQKAVNKRPLKNAFFTLDQHQNFVFISHGLRGLIQKEDHLLIGKSIWKEFPTLVYTDFYKLIQEASSRKKVVSFEYYIKSLLAWYHIQIEPLQDGTEVFFNDITELKNSQSNEKFLDEANTVLASSLDYYETLASLARLCVSTLADCCIIDLLENGEARSVEVAFADTSQLHLAREVKKFPPRRDNLKHPPAQALFLSKSVLIPEFNTKEAPAVGHNDAHARIITQVGPSSFIAVPLIARNKSLGALTLMITSSHRRFNRQDLQFAEELAKRAALHVDNARLYKESADAFLQLKENQNRLYQVLEAIPHMAWTALPDGTLTYYNQRWYDYMATAASQFSGSSWQYNIFPEDVEETNRRWNHSLLTGEKFEIENRFLRASDGQYRWHLTRAVAVLDSAQAVQLWVGTCTDIHEQKSAYENLNHIRKQLNTINAELVQKNHDLEKINHDLDNFVYAASHDLKAPVSNIEGLTNMLMGCIQEEQVKNHKIFTALHMIDFSIRKFKNTVQDLSDIAKINKNVYDDVKFIDVNEVIEEVLMMMGENIRKSGAKIYAQTDSHHQLHFSYANMKSLIYNLLSNAIKYADPSRQPVIHVSTYQQQQQFVLEVADNGVGIAPQNQSKIFEMFKRFQNHIEGSGLGLFLVKRIAENSGGKVTVESYPGKGSTFKVYLSHVS